jgi:hypothetical protein
LIIFKHEPFRPVLFALLNLFYILRPAEREPGLAVIGELGLGVNQDLFHGGDLDLIAMPGEHLFQFWIDHGLIGDLPCSFPIDSIPFCWYFNVVSEQKK